MTILVYGIFQRLGAQPVGIVRSLSRGLWTVFPALGIFGILAISWLFVTVLIGAVIRGIGNLGPEHVSIISSAVSIVIIAFLARFFWVILPVAVLERRFLSSFSRSVYLTKGNRWRILVIAILVIAISRLTYWGLGLLAVPLASLVESYSAIFLLAWATNAFVTVFSIVVVTVCYYHLQLVKDGVKERDTKTELD
jgi:hypothetical protein